jgi:hypothetical protein
MVSGSGALFWVRARSIASLRSCAWRIWSASRTMTVRRAKTVLGIKFQASDDGLLGMGVAEGAQTHVPEVSTFGESEHLPGDPNAGPWRTGWVCAVRGHSLPAPVRKRHPEIPLAPAAQHDVPPRAVSVEARPRMHGEARWWPRQQHRRWPTWDRERALSERRGRHPDE